MLAFGERSQLVLGSSQMLTLVLDTIFSLVVTMRTNWHFYMWETNWKSISGFHMNENQLWEPTQIYTFYFFGEADKLSHRTQIWFSESLYHLLVPIGLLLTWDYYYWLLLFIFSLGAVTLLLLLFSCCYYFSFYYYYSSPIITLLSLLLLP
jgi:hypothetical protein